MSRRGSTIPELYQRNEVYYVKWSEAGTRKRLSLGTTNRVEAQKRFASFLGEGHKIFETSGPRVISTSRALDDYMREHVAAKVVDQRRQQIAVDHLKTWFKDTPLNEVDIPASRAYADARRLGVVSGNKPTHSDSTILRELNVLSAAAGHALRWKRITAAEMPSIEMPRAAPQRDIWLTVPEWQRAVGAATGRLKDFMMVAYYTAGRRVSVERLTPFQIDLPNGRINLTSPNESAAQRHSCKRRPVVPIDPLVRPTIERLYETNKSTGWLFGDTYPMYKLFHRHMIAQGLPTKAHPHVLRHSRATHLLQAGVDIYAVARLLGDTVATVERVYGHHSSDYLAEAITRAAT